MTHGTGQMEQSGTRFYCMDQNGTQLKFINYLCIEFSTSYFPTVVDCGLTENVGSETVDRTGCCTCMLSITSSGKAFLGSHRSVCSAPPMGSDWHPDFFSHNI